MIVYFQEQRENLTVVHAQAVNEEIAKIVATVRTKKSITGPGTLKQACLNCKYLIYSRHYSARFIYVLLQVSRDQFLFIYF